MTDQSPEQPTGQPDPGIFAAPQNPVAAPVPAAVTPVNTIDVIDLDAERNARAAAREGRGEALPIRFGGAVVATLPVELPIDVFAPVRTLDESLTMVLRSAMQAFKAETQERRVDQTEMVIDLLAANPDMPVAVLDAIKQIAVNLLAQSGYDALMAARPTGQDIAALLKGVFRFYGVSLGEALPPSGSSTNDGETSNTTSGSTSDSTSEESGPAATPPTSSVSAVS